MMKTENQKIFLKEIQKDLNCDGGANSDDVFCKDNALTILMFIGNHVGFNQGEANTICDVMDGACQRTWTMASCVDDLTVILYPRLTDKDNQKRIAKKMTDLYKEEDLHDQLELLSEDEAHWEKDMLKFIEIFVQIHDDLGPGLLCNRVGKVLN